MLWEMNLGKGAIMEHVCKFEQDIGYIKAKIESIDKRINGSIDDIHDHIKSGHRWRITIMVMIVTIVLEVVAFAKVWGSVETKCARNEKDIAKIQELVSTKLSQ